MAIHKLADGPITLTITALRLGVQGNFGTQAAFDSGDTTVFISEPTALRQLSRLNLTTESVVGQTLHFAQTKKDGKTYTDINLVGAGTTPPQHVPIPAGQPMQGTTTHGTAVHGTTPRHAKLTVPEAAALYGECVDAAMATLGAKLEGVGIGASDMAIQAAAATLFIQVCRS